MALVAGAGAVAAVAAYIGTFVFSVGAVLDGESVQLRRVHPAFVLAIKETEVPLRDGTAHSAPT